MLTDQRFYLPGDVLWKVDCGAMACALEVRAPFLDHRVVEFANALPEAQLIQDSRGKRILREAFENELPLDVLGRPKKGFGVPIGTWFKGNLRDDLRDALLTKGSFVASHLEHAAVKRFVDEHNAGKRDHAPASTREIGPRVELRIQSPAESCGPISGRKKSVQIQNRIRTTDPRRDR